MLEERDIQIRGYRCGCRWTCCWSPAPTPRTTPTAAGSSPRSRTGSAPRCAPTTRSSSPTRSGCCTRRRTSPGRGGRRPSSTRSSPSTWSRSSPGSPGWSASPATSTSARASAPGSPSPALETVAASAVRRAAIAGETRPVARVVDLPSVVPASRGKVEFADSGADPDDERELEVLEHLLRQATAQTFRARCAGLDLTGLQEHFTGGETVESGELVPAPALLGQLGTIPKLAELLGRLGVPGGRAVGRAGRGRGRVRAGGAVPDPPAGQGHRRHPHGLRGLTMAGRRGRAATGTAGGTAGPTRSRRRTTSATPSTRSATRCWPAAASREALRELLRRGTEGRRGPGRAAPLGARAAAPGPHRRADGRHPGGGPRAARPGARPPSGASCSPTRTTPPGWPRPSWTRCPTTPPAPSGRSRTTRGARPEARQAYEQIQDLLRREVLDSSFASMKQALENASRGRHAGGQGHGRRPVAADRRAQPRRGHRRAVRRVHGQARPVLPGQPAVDRGAHRLPRPPGGRRRSG